MSRTAGRELAFKLLFEIQFQKDNSKEFVDFFIKNNEVKNEKVIKYLYEVSSGVIENTENINKLITDNLNKEWKIDRISKTNIALLKLAIFEIFYTKLPYKIVIDEILDLANQYSEESGSSFINGILGQIIKTNKIEE